MSKLKANSKNPTSINVTSTPRGTTVVVEEIIVEEEIETDEEEGGVWEEGSDGEMYYVITEEIIEEDGNDDRNGDKGENNINISEEVNNEYKRNRNDKRSSGGKMTLGQIGRDISVYSFVKTVSENKQEKKKLEEEEEEQIQQIIKKNLAKKRTKLKTNYLILEKKNTKKHSTTDLPISQKSTISPTPKRKTKEKRRSINNKWLNTLKNRDSKEKKIFGIELATVIEQQTIPVHPTVPVIIFNIVEHIRKNGKYESGLFRLCGHHETQLKIEKEIEKGIKIKLEDYDIHTVAAVLKSFLRQLPQPLIARHPFFSYFYSASEFKNEELKFTYYASLINCLHIHEKTLLQYMCFFLREIVWNESSNFMNASNLAVVFSPSFLGELPLPVGPGGMPKIDATTYLEDSKIAGAITKDLITNAPEIFDEDVAPAELYYAQCSFSTRKISIIRGDTIVVFKKDGENCYVDDVSQTGKYVILPRKLINSLERIQFFIPKQKIDKRSLFLGGKNSNLQKSYHIGSLRRPSFTNSKDGKESKKNKLKNKLTKGGNSNNNNNININENDDNECSNNENQENNDNNRVIFKRSHKRVKSLTIEEKEELKVSDNTFSKSGSKSAREKHKLNVDRSSPNKERKTDAGNKTSSPKKSSKSPKIKRKNDKTKKNDKKQNIINDAVSNWIGNQ